MNTSNDLPILVSRERAAQILGGVNLRTVDRLADRGDLRPLKLGRRVMFRADAIREFVNKLETRSA